MSLRKQLLLVGLLILVLPWAGCQWVREIESALREDRQGSLLREAASRAILLRDRTDLLYPNSDRYRHAIDPSRVIYSHPLEVPIRIDGYGDDWAAASVQSVSLPTGAGADDTLSYLVGFAGRYLYLFIAVVDDQVIYRAPGSDVSGDRIVLGIEASGASQALVVSTEAPGLTIPTHARDSRWRPGETRENRILGNWQPTATGFNVELRVPIEIAADRFGLAVVDVDGDGATQTIGTWRNNSQKLGRIVFASPRLRDWLDDYRPPAVRSTVVDHLGFKLASTGSLLPPNSITGESERNDFFAGLYEAILDSPLPPYPDTLQAAGRLDGAHLNAALEGNPSAIWYDVAGENQALIASAQPIHAGELVIGAVVLEQSSDAILTLTNRALTELLSVTLLAGLVVGLGLLGYASWLSVRIRKLAAAAERALGPRGNIHASLPGGRSRDELGDLSRSFSRLLDRLSQYNSYLRGLAGKLSHELRTPLAVVSSSLDNLEHELPESALAYAQRARDGTRRLNALIAAMSAATRLEQSIEHAEVLDFDLKTLAASCVEGYADAYSDRAFRLRTGLDQCAMHGAPELIAQALDKLVDNAVSFSPEGALIEVSLQQQQATVDLGVSNPGPPLPETMRSQLFDSLVSLRKHADQTPHLGFGLHIARLIVEFHHGSIDAANRSDGDGAIFTMRFPL